MTELIDLLENSGYLHNDLFGHGSGNTIDIGDAASRLVYFIPNPRDSIMKVREKITWSIYHSTVSE